MKKVIIIVLLVICMAFSLLACGRENPCVELECCEAHIGDGNCHCHGHCVTAGCRCHGAH